MDLKDFKTIETIKFSDTKKFKYLNEDASKLLYLDSPAIEVFRDYKTTAALVTSSDTVASDIKKKMKLANKDVILVINSEDRVTGIIDLHYLEGVALQKLAQDSGTNIKDLTAEEIKLDITKVRMIHYDMLEDAKIGHIIKTLLKDNRHQILIYEEDENGNPFIRGYFALSYIKRKLGLEVHLSHQKDGVASISKVMMN
ncbi:CBS domain-containing protein [Francisella frigiditurris]|uniref:CBS domain protein n=1 Tax=Francisella frigiditurris TaxID=1542390 RepID=A0A1J0KUI1_9GAMM|nr:hypothetical protein [Francisella frigiditurris]APC97401.1 CBS domain protein [Francisella frigiditurris]